jgi:hypothetical protein
MGKQTFEVAYEEFERYEDYQVLDFYQLEIFYEGLI